VPLESAVACALVATITARDRADGPVSEKQAAHVSRFREKEEKVRAILYRLGRTLQLIGLILLPFAIAGNLSPEKPLDLRESLTLSGVGIVVFGLGWLLQQAGAK
jgi:hypothetical protein